MSRILDQLGGLPMFDGPTNEADNKRLTLQMERVFKCLESGEWLTLSEIRERTGDPEASISAQIRHLRKPRFGCHTIVKQRRGCETSGLWEYKLEV